MISESELIEILNNNKEPFEFDKLEKAIIDRINGAQGIPDLTYLADILEKVSDSKTELRYQYNKLIISLTNMEAKGLCTLEYSRKMRGAALKKLFQSTGFMK